MLKHSIQNKKNGFYSPAKNVQNNISEEELKYENIPPLFSVGISSNRKTYSPENVNFSFKQLENTGIHINNSEVQPQYSYDPNYYEYLDRFDINTVFSLETTNLTKW